MQNHADPWVYELNGTYYIGSQSVQQRVHRQTATQQPLTGLILRSTGDFAGLGTAFDAASSFRGRSPR